MYPRCFQFQIGSCCSFRRLEERRVREGGKEAARINSDWQRPALRSSSVKVWIENEWIRGVINPVASGSRRGLSCASLPFEKKVKSDTQLGLVSNTLGWQLGVIE